MGCLLWWWLRPEAKRMSFISIGLPPRVRTTTWSPRLLPSSNIQERTFMRKCMLTSELKQFNQTDVHAGLMEKVDTYCLSNGEHFPAGRVDWNKTGRQQLLPLRVVASTGVKQLINTNLNGRRVITVMSKAEICLVGFTGFYPINLLSINATYLAEMVPVEYQCCLRSQLEKMELCSENLLSSGNRRQVEPVLHLFTAHCNEILSLESRKAQQHFISYSSQEQTRASTSPILHLSKKLRTVFPSRRYGSLVTPSTSATVLYKSSMY